VAEADGDIREAMDFCRFYAHQMRFNRRHGSRSTFQVRKLSAFTGLAASPRDRAMEFSDGHLCGMVTAPSDRQHRDHETGRTARHLGRRF